MYSIKNLHGYSEFMYKERDVTSENESTWKN